MGEPGEDQTAIVDGDDLFKRLESEHGISTIESASAFHDMISNAELTTSRTATKKGDHPGVVYAPTKKFLARVGSLLTTSHDARAFMWKELYEQRLTSHSPEEALFLRVNDMNNLGFPEIVEDILRFVKDGAVSGLTIPDADAFRRFWAETWRASGFATNP